MRPRSILVASETASMLPADAGCRVVVVGDVADAAADLLTREPEMEVLVFLPPARAGGLLALPGPDLAGRWAGVLVEPGAAGAASLPDDRRFYAYRTTSLTRAEVDHLVRTGWLLLEEWTLRRADDERHAAELTETSADLESLVRIGQALSQQKDQGKLFRTILSISKKITGADAGSISLVEPDGLGGRRLRFKYSHTFSKDLPEFEEQVMPLQTKSLAAHVVATGQVLNIPDAYELGDDLPYRFNPGFDRTFDYRTRSMLAVPMRNHVDDVIGVIQLINCKESRHPATGNEAFEVYLRTPQDFRDLVIPFPQRYESLMQAVASQAAIAIENNRMIEQIRSQFENFVRASVAAIESRDPPTSGHSFRVTQMSLNMARAVNRVTEGKLAALEFPEHALRELELAGLLHDFGKVYIESAVFLKARRMYPADYQHLMLRLEYLYRSLELQQLVAAVGPRRPEGEHGKRLEAVLAIRDAVQRLNEPGDIPDRAAIIRNILRRQGELCVPDLSGVPIPLLTDKEASNLGITRGTLNDEERKVIESHVTYTSAFVEKIPWPAEFAGIPRITRAHHERLDGTGYPDGLTAAQLTPQAKIMAIADVYDALAAADRPYKKAVPRERVLEILRQEADAGKLDTDLVELFIREKAFILDTEATETTVSRVDGPGTTAPEATAPQATAPVTTAPVTTGGPT